MPVPFLQDIFVIFALAIAVVFLCQLLRVPPIVGFLATGTLAGPSGLGLIGDLHQVETMAEVGVILLLFTIGLEFSLSDLLKIRRLVLLGGSLQVAITTAVTFACAALLGRPFGEAVFLGFLVSLSSTAIVLKALQQSSEISAPHGRAILGVLILQDIAIVPMMLCVPLLSGDSTDVVVEVLGLLLKGATVVLLAILGTQWIVPWVLARIVGTRSNELFLLGIAAICFGVAWLTHSLGLSLALGAFLAGLILSESEYSHRALGNVLPFRDVFTSFFFVSIGMLLDVGFAYDHFWLVGASAAGIVLIKAGIAGGVILGLGMPFRVAVLSGLGLAQVGEFSFVLSKTGVDHGLLSPDLYQGFLVVSLMTMAATPFVINGSHRMAEAVGRLPVPERWRAGRYFVPAAARSHLTDHVVIVGFGVIGQNLARSAKLAGIPYQIIEINHETVRRERGRGEPIFYGDASQPAALEHANLSAARVLVVAIPDPGATRRVVDAARCLNPSLHILARTRYLGEMDALGRAGADEVIPEEFEAAVTIFSRVLDKYLIPSADIERYVCEARADGYRAFRGARHGLALPELDLPRLDVEVRVFRLTEGSELADRSLADSDLRRAHEISVLAVRRAGEVISNPTGDFVLGGDDVVVVLGKPDKILAAATLFER